MELVPRLYDSRKRILVTGGAGSLGPHPAERLLEGGAKKYVSSSPAAREISNIFSLNLASTNPPLSPAQQSGQSSRFHDACIGRFGFGGDRILVALCAEALSEDDPKPR
jgi:nucleoside-diphosphate-sugar epimerase